MKKIAILTAVIVFSIGIATLAGEAQGDVTAVRVVRRVDQHPGSSLLGIPGVAQWKAKHLVVTYEAGIAGKIDMGDIFACVSSNDGASWSEPSIVFDHNQRHGNMQFGYANPILYKPPKQDVLWCFAMRCPLNYQHSEDAHLAAAYSGDGGRSWVPVELAMHYTGPLVIVGGILRVVENGEPRYLLPAHRNTRRNDPLGTREQFVLSSTSLLDWRLAGYVPQPATDRVFLHEGALAVGDQDGELKMVMRTAQYEQEGKALDPPRAFSTTSLDGGRSWTPARSEPELWNSVSKGEFVRSADGTHVYVYSDGPAWSRMALRYKVQPPGKEWGPERTFFDTGTHNSYPTLVEVAPGEYLAVWDGGTKERHRTEIRFGKFKPSAGP